MAAYMPLRMPTGTRHSKQTGHRASARSSSWNQTASYSAGASRQSSTRPDQRCPVICSIGALTSLAAASSDCDGRVSAQDSSSAAPNGLEWAPAHSILPL